MPVPMEEIAHQPAPGRAARSRARLLEDSLDPVLGPIRQPRPVARFEHTPTRIGAPAPSIGQHSDEIRSELGMAGEIARLRESGVIA